MYTEQVSVLRGHLEEWLDALEAAYGYHAANDLAQQYRNVGGTTRHSNLTKRLESALERVTGYLIEEEDNELSDN
jgi:hypothetical protein